MKCLSFISLGLVLAAVNASPTRRAPPPSTSFGDKNVQDAIELNEKFKNTKEGGACTVGESACIGPKIAQCVGGKFVAKDCEFKGSTCTALPLMTSQGTTVSCAIQEFKDAIFAAANGQGAGKNTSNTPPPQDGGKDGGKGGGKDGNTQTSTTLDPSVIAQGFASDGQDPPVKDQVPSLTSKNNFINFCKTVKFPITNGQQIKTGSCNPAPMGVIPSTAHMPSSKFVFPKNGGTIKPGKTFTIQMAIKNLETGNFVNANQNYFGAPQTLNGQGVIRGHSHVVIEKLTSLDQTTPSDPSKFAFFKGLNEKAKGGILTAAVDKGLQPGAYKMCSINSSSNHQPVLVPIAQHASLDDCSYFTVKN